MEGERELAGGNESAGCEFRTLLGSSVSLSVKQGSLALQDHEDEMR